MARIAVFGLGLAAKSPYVTAKLVQNMYAEQRTSNTAGQSEKSVLVGYQTPGLNLFADFGAPIPRGGQELEAFGLAYVVIGGTFYEINNAGVFTSRGMLSTTSGRVSTADNGQQILIVDGTFGYLYQPSAVGIAAQTISSITRSSTTATLTTLANHGLSTGMIVIISGAVPSQYSGTFEVTVTGATTFTYTMASDPGGSASPVGAYTVSAFNQITDPGFPTNPVTATFMSGRFIVNSSTAGVSGRFNWSNLFDGWVWPALNFANAQTNPDPVAAVWSSNGQLIPLGTKSMEFWGDSGTVDTAFTQIVGTATEWGLAAVFSVAKFGNSFACLVRNRTGQCYVAKMVGYQPQEISNPDIDSIINGYATVADAQAFSYMLGGHPMYVINFPTAQASWLYDGSTNAWTMLKSYGMSMYRGSFAFSFLGSIIVADNSVGRLYKISAAALTDNGDSIERMLISETIADPDLDRIEINKFRVDIQVGSGTTSGQGVNPQLGLSVSRDNGKTYGAEMMRGMGALGEYATTLDWDNLGTWRNFVFKLRCTDPVPFVLVSASVNPND